MGKARRFGTVNRTEVMSVVPQTYCTALGLIGEYNITGQD